MILLTGATGFIGSYVHRQLLEHGHDVVGLSRYEPRRESQFLLSNFEPFVERVELRDRDALGQAFAVYRPDTVIHLDAYVNPIELQRDPLRAIDFNFMETINVLECARETPGTRVVFASSIAVLPSIRYEPIDGNHPILTTSEGPGGGFYGAAKAASEVFGMSYCAAFDLDFRVVRPSAVYGFGMQWPIGIKPVIEGLVRGEPVTIFRNAPFRDFTPVEDVATLFAAAAECRDDFDRILYAGTGLPLVSSVELYDIVLRLFPNGAITLSDDAIDGGSIESRYRGRIDMTSAKVKFGFRSAFATLEEGLDAYAERYREFLTSDYGRS